MITLEQAIEFLEGKGISLPEFMLVALLEISSGITECMDEHNYSDAAKTVILLNLLGLMALGDSDGRISSQSAPSGASQSFKYESISTRYKAMLGMVNMFDKDGCAAALIPPNPEGSGAGLWISPGSKDFC